MFLVLGLEAQEADECPWLDDLGLEAVGVDGHCHLQLGGMVALVDEAEDVDTPVLACFRDRLRRSSWTSVHRVRAYMVARIADELVRLATCDENGLSKKICDLVEEGQQHLVCALGRLRRCGRPMMYVVSANGELRLRRRCVADRDGSGGLLSWSEMFLWTIGCVSQGLMRFLPGSNLRLGYHLAGCYHTDSSD